ncbi:MAG: biotin/lipoyl-containing protein [Parvularculaceae bacterium]
MGDKAKAKREMLAAGVPCIPGYQGTAQDDETLRAEAVKIGFPVMIKAAAGGGGRGMRLVQSAEELASAIKTAREEAQNTFGAGDLILEKAIAGARHVEIQVFADAHGNIVHMGERDCSVQRRHQKVLEEAPCPVMTPALRKAMGETAKRAAKEIGYEGAGTVEFLLDNQGDFYFLEMNTRLQVEHPVTEMITGLDLVELQIDVAQGKPLAVGQDVITLHGHAIEARIYAEDTAQGFLPATGPIEFWAPAQMPGVRIDAGIKTGGSVSPFYDSMIAKVIAHGATREEARRRLVIALKETALFGVKTNKRFLIDALERPDFVEGRATTAFIDANFTSEALAVAPPAQTALAVGALLLYLDAYKIAFAKCLTGASSLFGWSSATAISRSYRFEAGEKTATVVVTPAGGDRFSILSDDESLQCRVLEHLENSVRVEIGDERLHAQFFIPEFDNSSRVKLCLNGVDIELTDLNSVLTPMNERAGAGAIIAPMHGMLVELSVKPGQTVVKGERLAILEAMKMQHELLCGINGKVSVIHAAAGSQVAANSVLLEVTPASEQV